MTCLRSHLRIRMLLGIALLTVLSGGSAAAALPALTPAGYGGGGRFTAVAVHPGNPDIVLIGSDVAGVFKSTDGGRHFRLTGQDLDGFSVADIVFHPISGHWVFLLSDGGLYASDSQGERWEKISGEVRYRGRFSGSRLMVFSRYSLWIGTDEKGVFQLPLNISKPHVVPVPGLDGTKINALTIHRNRLLAATSNGIYRYEAGRWKSMNNGLSPDNRDTVNLAGDAERRLYLVERSRGAYLWNSKSARWESRGVGLIRKLPHGPDGYKALGVHPVDSADVWMATHPRTWPHLLLHSDDAGESWRPVDNFQPAEDTPDHWAIAKTVSAVEAIVFSQARPSVGFLTDWWNVWKTVDHGRSWHQLHHGLQNTVVNDIKVHPSRPDTLYMSTWDNGLMVSRDGGLSWKRKMNGVADGHVQEVVFSHRNPSKMYLLANPWHEKEKIYVYRTFNGGDTWEDIGFDRPDMPLPEKGFVSGRATNLAVDPFSDDVVYVATNGYGIFKTVNGGKSWQAASSGLDTPYLKGTGALVIHPENSRILYASTQQGGIYKSTDGARTWRRLSSSDAFTFGLAIDPSDPEHIVAAAADKTLLISEDGGDTWKARKLPGIARPHIAAGTVVFHPQDPSVLLVGTLAYDFKAADGLYLSTDGGRSFVQVTMALPKVSINDLVIRRTEGISAYIGFSGIGLFRIDMEKPEK